MGDARRKPLIPLNNLSLDALCQNFNERFDFKGFLCLLPFEIQRHSYNNRFHTLLSHDLADPIVHVFVVWDGVVRLGKNEERIAQGETDSRRAKIDAKNALVVFCHFNEVRESELLAKEALNVNDSLHFLDLLNNSRQVLGILDKQDNLAFEHRGA